MAKHYVPDIYEDLEDGRHFVKANVAGVSFRQQAVSGWVEGQPLELARDRRNGHDRIAIRVFSGGAHIGFVPRDINTRFATCLDTGKGIEAEIEAVVEGTPDKAAVGVVMRPYLPEDVPMEFDEEWRRGWRTPPRNRRAVRLGKGPMPGPDGSAGERTP